MERKPLVPGANAVRVPRVLAPLQRLVAPRPVGFGRKPRGV